MGKQTVIHEKVLNARSMAEFMELYEDWASFHDKDVNHTRRNSGPKRTLFFLKHYLEPQGGPVLDAGCGAGLVGAALSRGGFRSIDGIDYSIAMLAEAAKKMAYQQLEQMNMNTALPIEAGVYDGVTCVGTFTSARVVPEALRELVRVTRPGGSLLHCARGVLARHAVSRGAQSDCWVEGAPLKQLCDEPFIHSEGSTCKMVLLEFTHAA